MRADCDCTGVCEEADEAENNDTSRGVVTMQSLHDQIMNIECDSMEDVDFRIGFREAIRTAKRLAIPFDEFVAEMRKLSESGDCGRMLEDALKRLDGIEVDSDGNG